VTEPHQSHFLQVANLIDGGFVTPFLGAGANLVDRPADAGWTPESPFLPNGGELAAALAKASGYPDTSDTDLLRVAQFLDASLGEGGLYMHLRPLFSGKYEPTSLHRFLANVAKRLRERGTPRQLLITTNYDVALERAFDEAGESYDVVWYEARRKHPERTGKFWHRPARPAAGSEGEEPVQPEPILIKEPNSYTGLSFDERTIILKLHGAVDPDGRKQDSFVVTEDSYIDYLSRGDIADALPATVKERMEESYFLFLGYSMRDWNLRVILNRIWGARQLDLMAWSVQLKPKSEAQAQIEETLCRQRGEHLTPLYAPLEDYVAALEATLFQEAAVST
jgi:SIR2-like domain